MCCVLNVSNFERFSLTIARWLTTSTQRRSESGNYATQWDATLAQIQETVLLYPGTEGRPRARRILTDTDPTTTLQPRHLRPQTLTWVIHPPSLKTAYYQHL